MIEKQVETKQRSTRCLNDSPWITSPIGRNMYLMENWSSLDDNNSDDGNMFSTPERPLHRSQEELNNYLARNHATIRRTAAMTQEEVGNSPNDVTNFSRCLGDVVFPEQKIRLHEHFAAAATTTTHTNNIKSNVVTRSQTGCFRYVSTTDLEPQHPPNLVRTTNTKFICYQGDDRPKDPVARMLWGSCIPSTMISHLSTKNIYPS